MAPPTDVVSPHGQKLDLLAIARRTCTQYDLEYPDERTRYGPAGMEWCVHDNQHLLNWAVLSLTVELDFEAQLAWLASVLEARNFPLERLARNLELLASTVRTVYPGEPEVVAAVTRGAALVGSRKTFL